MRHLPARPYIIWSCDPRKLDPEDPWTRRWWIAQVLIHGRLEDVRLLDWGEIRRLLPDLRLPPKIRKLWEFYFAATDARARAGTDSMRSA